MPLEVGMVISVETTLQHPARGFIKLEDTVVVTETGHEIYGEGARGWNRAGTVRRSLPVIFAQSGACTLRIHQEHVRIAPAPFVKSVRAIGSNISAVLNGTRAADFIAHRRAPRIDALCGCHCSEDVNR